MVEGKRGKKYVTPASGVNLLEKLLSLFMSKCDFQIRGISCRVKSDRVRENRKREREKERGERYGELE